MSVTDGSKVLRTLRRAGGSLAAAVEDSYFVTDMKRARARIGVAAGHSRARAAVGDTAGALGRWVRNSWLYGWLTAEPEPDVIVVDLRETYTVGPLLAVLDRAVAWSAPRWRDSSPRRLLERATTTVVDAPIRVAGWVGVGVLLARLAITVAEGGDPGGTLLVALGLALLATRERRSAARLRETWAGRTLAALLVPPEPPENEASDRDERGRE